MKTLEILNLIVIPTALALLPLIWGLTDWMIKRAQFLELIFRELEEIRPFPETKDPQPKEHWSKHVSKKSFLHIQFFEKVTENRDFILSLPSDVVYYVTQLWNSQDNSEQWLFMLSMLETKVPFWQQERRKEIAKVKNAWYVLMKEYSEVFEAEFEEKHCPKFSELYPDQQQRLNKLHEK